MILYVARHGQTADNALRIFQGHAGKGLNLLGRAQAERLGERLKQASLAAIVTSDLERAVETATIVARACGVPVELDPGLREVDVGTWTGRSYDEVASLYPEQWAAARAGLDVRRGGGESYSELAARMDAAIRRIVSRHATATAGPVLVVSHGGAIKSWVSQFLDAATVRRDEPLGAISNTGLTVVERDPRTSSFLLRSWNDISHLEDLVGPP